MPFVLVYIHFLVLGAFSGFGNLQIYVCCCFQFSCRRSSFDVAGVAL
jgi:hypothetical protein